MIEHRALKRSVVVLMVARWGDWPRYTHSHERGKLLRCHKRATTLANRRGGRGEECSGSGSHKVTQGSRPDGGTENAGAGHGRSGNSLIRMFFQFQLTLCSLWHGVVSLYWLSTPNIYLAYFLRPSGFLGIIFSAISDQWERRNVSGWENDVCW